MRIKEEMADYRYLPEADLPPLSISNEWVDSIRDSLPEFAEDRRKRYVSDLGISQYDAEVLTASKEMSDFFNQTVEAGADPKQAANWLMGDISAYLNKENVELSDTQLTPESLAEMIQLIDQDTISSKIGKKVYLVLIKEGSSDVQALVEEKGWVQLSDPAKLEPIINDILDQNQQSIEDFKAGKDRAKGFLVGQVMKETRGKANPQVVNQLLDQELNKR